MNPQEIVVDDERDHPMIRTTVAPLAAIAAALVMIPAGASANPFPNGPAHRTYRAAFIECNQMSYSRAWSLASAVRSVERDYQAAFQPIAAEGCRAGWKYRR